MKEERLQIVVAIFLIIFFNSLIFRYTIYPAMGYFEFFIYSNVVFISFLYSLQNNLQIVGSIDLSVIESHDILNFYFAGFKCSKCILRARVCVCVILNFAYYRTRLLYRY